MQSRAGAHIANRQTRKSDCAPPKGEALGSRPAPSKIFRQQNCFSDLSHRLSSLTALFLHHLVSIFFAQRQITLQNALRTVYRLPRLKSAGQLRILSFQSRPFNLCAYKKSQSREQPHLFVRMPVRHTMLQVDDPDHPPSTENWRTQHRLNMIFGDILEGLEPRIVRSRRRNGHRLPVLRHPSRNALSDLNPNMIDQV